MCVNVSCYPHIRIDRVRESLIIYMRMYIQYVVDHQIHMCINLTLQHTLQQHELQIPLWLLLHVSCTIKYIHVYEIDAATQLQQHALQTNL